MSAINSEVLKALIEKHGPTINLRTQSNVLAEILGEIGISPPRHPRAMLPTVLRRLGEGGRHTRPCHIGLKIP